MNRIVLVINALLLGSQLSYGFSINDLNPQSVHINACEYVRTDNNFDVAIIHDGYLVVNRGVSNHNYYTRRGSLMLDKDYHIVTDQGDHVLGFDLTKSVDQLTYINISSYLDRVNSTSNVEIKFNLPSYAVEGDDYAAIYSINDALGQYHVQALKFKKTAKKNNWSVQVEIDEEKIAEATLQFQANGELEENDQQILLKWKHDNELQEMRVFLKGTTQYAKKYTVISLQQDGHASGDLELITINKDGGFEMHYTDGGTTNPPITMALANFVHPQKLRKVVNDLYDESTDSGKAKISYDNGNGEFLVGYLEKEPCMSSRK